MGRFQQASQRFVDQHDLSNDLGESQGYLKGVTQLVDDDSNSATLNARCPVRHGRNIPGRIEALQVWSLTSGH